MHFCQDKVWTIHPPLPNDEVIEKTIPTRLSHFSGAENEGRCQKSHSRALFADDAKSDKHNIVACFFKRNNRVAGVISAPAEVSFLDRFLFADLH